MTPLEISILLHYSYSPEDFRQGDFSAPAVREAIDRFRDVDSLLTKSDRDGQTYALSERGRVYVEALQSLPLPIKTWLMPTTDFKRGLNAS